MSQKINQYLIWLGLYAIPIHFMLHDDLSRLTSIGCVVAIIVISLLSNNQENIFRSHFSAKWFRLLLLAVFTATVYWSFSKKYDINDIMLILIPLLMIFCSYYSFREDNDGLEKRLRLYVIFCSITALVVIINSGGFVFYDLYREGVNKNQTAPFYGQIGIISLALLVSEKKNFWRIFMLMSFLLCLSYSIFLQARTSLFAMMAIAAIIVYKQRNNKGVLLIIALSIFALIMWGDNIIHLFSNSFIAGDRDLHDLSSLTSGRTDRNALALQYISDNLFFGAGCNDSISNYIFSDYYLIPHNFVLYRLVKYGIIGALPQMIIYIIVVKTLLPLFRSGNYAAFGCLLLAVIESLVEYESPFGPGTTYMICYFLLGRYLYLNNQ